MSTPYPKQWPGHLDRIAKMSRTPSLIATAQIANKTFEEHRKHLLARSANKANQKTVLLR
jgi:hypothetical protein